MLRCGAELVVHAYRTARAPGRERLERMGLDHEVLPATGTSEDVAMLLAYELGAKLIVTVGSHFNLIEFLDKDREGMSSTFLTRLRVGDILVDTKGVSRLYRAGPSRRLLFLLVARGAGDLCHRRAQLAPDRAPDRPRLAEAPGLLEGN